MHALLPIKTLANAKQRLASLLSASEREALVLAMAADLLSQLGHHPMIEQITVICEDPAVVKLARQSGCDVVDEASLLSTADTGDRLNRVLNRSVAKLAARGVAKVLVLHGDLPLLQQADLSALLRRHQLLEPSAVTLCPDRHGTGTNALVCRPSSAIEFRFGSDSLARHLMAADAAGLDSQIFNATGFAHDIDLPDDIELLCSYVSDDNLGCTGHLIRSWQLHQRLQLASVDVGQVELRYQHKMAQYKIPQNDIQAPAMALKNDGKLYVH